MLCKRLFFGCIDGLCSNGPRVIRSLIDSLQLVLFSRIRLYNRSSSAASQSTLQSCRHILVTEGPLAFYKGFSTHFMRIGPHFTLTFVFLGMLKRQIIEGSQPEVVESRKASTAIIHGMEDGTSSTSASITSSVIPRREEQM